MLVLVVFSGGQGVLVRHQVMNFVCCLTFLLDRDGLVRVHLAQLNCPRLVLRCHRVVPAHVLGVRSPRVVGQFGESPDETLCRRLL